MNLKEISSFLNSDCESKIKYDGTVKVDLFITHVVKLWERKVFKVKEDIKVTKNLHLYGSKFGGHLKVKGREKYTGKELVALLKTDD